jgi:DNA polymerase-4
MARDQAEWLARKQITARTVTIKVRYGDFTTVTRSHSARPTSDAVEIAQRAVQLLEKTEAGRRPVRLLGAGVHNLERMGEGEVAQEAGAPRLPFEEADSPRDS